MLDSRTSTEEMPKEDGNAASSEQPDRLPTSNSESVNIGGSQAVQFQIAHMVASLWLQTLGPRILSRPEFFVYHCIMQNEIQRGKRYSQEQLHNDIRSCYNANYFEEMLLYDSKENLAAREAARLHSLVLKENYHHLGLSQ
jgi:hypothetical protein